MPSDFGRGVKFGAGFALGLCIIMGLFLLGVSMCAGRMQQRMMEELKEQLEEMRPPERRPDFETSVDGDELTVGFDYSRSTSGFGADDGHPVKAKGQPPVLHLASPQNA